MAKSVYVIRYPKRDHPRDTYNSLCPLTWLLILFSINCNATDTNNICANIFLFIKNLFTMALLGGLDMYSLYYKFKYIYPTKDVSLSIKLTDTLQMIFNFCQYIVDLGFVYKYGKNISCEYFQQYSYIDPILNMTAYSNIKWRLARKLLFFTFIWLASSVFDFLVWCYIYGWLIPTVYSIAYIFFYIKILTTLDLSSHVMHIEVRLKIIANIVYHYYLLAEAIPGMFMGDFLTNKNWLYSKVYSSSSKPHLNPMKLQSTEESDKIKWLTRCYMHLTEQVEFINCIFGFRILLNSASLLIDMVRFTNMTIRIMLGTKNMPIDMKYYGAASILMREISCMLVVINLVRTCGQAYAQRDRILNTIDHILINRKPNEKLRPSIIELRQMVQNRPIKFHLSKFFYLDNKFLVSIGSVVVTYTIILIQVMKE